MEDRIRVNTPKWKRDYDARQARLVSLRAAAAREMSIDKFLLFVVLALTLFGLVMVYSSSAMLAQKRYGGQFHFLIRQSAWALIGLAGMASAIRIDYRHYKRPAVVLSLLGLSVAMLAAVLFFPAVNGAHRWFRYGAASLQPSEIAKPALVLVLAFFLERQAEKIKQFRLTFLPAALVAGVMMGLVALEPDLGTALSMGLIFGVVVFVAGVRLSHLGMLLLPVIPGLTYMLLVPWRFQRIMDLFDPWKNQTTSSFQTAQSLISIGSGGLTGLGFAQGKQKLFYLPSPHTDFIFAVIGEELGLIGAGLIVLAFGTVAWRGWKAARTAPDQFGQLLAMGLTVMIAAQAFFNISVALSLLPAKGIPLPFISCGGSSLAINLAAAGVLMNISKHSSEYRI